MKNKRDIIASALIAAGLLVLVYSLPGCVRANTPSTPRPDATALLGGQAVKDSTVTASADRIDVLSVDTPQAAPVKIETDAIRKAVIDAPAADVSRLIAQFEGIIARLDKELAAEKKARAAAEQQALREQARWLTWTGIGFMAAFGISLFAGGGLAGAFKTWPLLVLGAGCFGLAQVISHPWFLKGFAGLLLLSVAYTAYWIYDSHKQGRLREALEKRERLLKQVLPVLDDAYENGEEAVKKILDRDVFAPLTGLFSKQEKAEVHTIRAELKAS